jgi:prevent-host-death family protein
MQRYTLDMSKALQRKEPIEVGVRELRDHLSRWLEQAKDGRELVITERGRPIARITGAAGGSKLAALIADGVVTPASAPARPAEAYPRPRPSRDVADLVAEQRR